MTGSDYPGARRRADRLTATYPHPPIPVLDIAEAQGVNVVFARFGSSSVQTSGYCDFRKAELFINGEDCPRRQSFTIAHELGHWLMHRHVFMRRPALYSALPRFRNSSSADRRETAANTFAAHLLVPDRLLKPVLSPHVSAAALAEIFFVSRIMMEQRIRRGRTRWGRCQ